MTRGLDHFTIEVDDVTVGVTKGRGIGIPLVFIHGFTVNRRLYDPMLEILAFNGFSVTALDLPGHGETGLLEENSIDDIVDFVLAALDKLDVHRAVFVGHSLGGRIVTEIAAITDRAIEVVLIGAAVGQPFDDYENRHIAKKILSTPIRGLASVIDTLASGPLKLCYYADVAAAISSSWHGLGDVGWDVTFGVDTVTPLYALYVKDIPTTIIHGQRDLIVPLACAESAANISGGRLRVIPGAFHSWLIANPELGAAEIQWALSL